MNKRLSFDELYVKHGEYVYKIAYHILQDEQMAADIMQEVFFKLYKVFDKTHQNGIKTWLNRTATNMSINCFKKRSRRNDSECYIEDNQVESALESPEDKLILQEDDAKKEELLEKVMNRLMVKNEKWYDAVLLCYYLKIPQQEAADSLGITKDSLKGILQRVKKWAMKEYGIEYHEMAGDYELK